MSAPTLTLNPREERHAARRVKGGAVPFRFQSSLNDCAPACVYAICEHYGIRTTIGDLRRRLNADPEKGVSIASFASGLHDLLEVEAGKVVGQTAPHLYPFVAYLPRERHFVVVWRRDGDRLTIGDPSVGLHAVSEVEFSLRWDGISIVLRPRSGIGEIRGGMRFEAPSSMQIAKSLFKGNWSGFAWLSVLAALRGLAGTAFSILFPGMLANMHHLLALASAYLCVSLALGLSGAYYRAAIRKRYCLLLGRRLFARMHVLEKRYYTVGDIFTRFQDITNVVDVVGLILRDGPYAVAVALGAFFFLARSDWALACEIVLIVVGILVGLESFVDKARSYFYTIRLRTSHLNNRVRDFWDRTAPATFESAWSDLVEASFRQSLWLMPVNALVSQFLVIMLIIMSGWALFFHSSGAISENYATLLTIITIVNYLVSALSGLYSSYVQWQTAAPAVHRLNDFIEHQ